MRSPERWHSRRHGEMHRGKLKPGATWRIQVKVTVKAGHGTIRDKAGLAGITPDPRRANNTAVTVKIIS